MTTSFEENEFQFFSVRLALGRGRERIFKFRVSHVFIFFSSLFFYSSSEGNKLHFLLCVLFPHPLEREEGRRKKKAKCCLSTWQSRNVQLSGTDACTRETREVKKKKGLEKKNKTRRSAKFEMETLSLYSNLRLNRGAKWVAVFCLVFCLVKTPISFGRYFHFLV